LINAYYFILTHPSPVPKKPEELSFNTIMAVCNGKPLKGESTGGFEFYVESPLTIDLTLAPAKD
jgi:hypothetical protein